MDLSTNYLNRRSLVAWGFDHWAAIGCDQRLYMWGSLEHYGKENLSEEDYYYKVPIMHNGKEYIPINVSWGNQYTMVVCTTKESSYDTLQSNNLMNKDGDDGIGGLNIPSAYFKPSMDSRKEDFEFFYQYLRAILDIEDNYGSEKPYSNLWDLFKDEENEDDEGYPEGPAFPRYFENYSVSIDSFTDKMTELVERKDSSKCS